MPAKSSNISNLQLEIIKLFNYELDKTQLNEIKNVLANYFAQKVTDELDGLWEKNKWDNKTISKWSKEHLRTSYK